MIEVLAALNYGQVQRLHLLQADGAGQLIWPIMQINTAGLLQPLLPLSGFGGGWPLTQASKRAGKPEEATTARAYLNPLPGSTLLELCC